MINNSHKKLQVPLPLVFFLTAFLPVCGFSLPSVNAGVLFVAYDQGESNAFIEIQKQLDREGIPYRILALGRARDVFAGHPNVLLTDPALFPAHHSFDRELLLDEYCLKTLAEQLSPQVIYTGMASAAQAQIANALESEHSRTIAFYDNLDPLSNKKYVQPFINRLKTLDEFHVPSDKTAESFRVISQSLQSEIVVTGQPSLAGWDQVFLQTDKNHLRTQLGVNDGRQVFVFAGGYDDGYPESFTMFVQATQDSPDTLFLVTHHPKYSGDLEQGIINQYAQRNVRLIRKGEFSTAELCTIASGVIVHQSTVAYQALYKGVPALYVASESFSNLILEYGIAERAYSVDAVREWFGRSTHLSGSSIIRSLGVPEQPAAIIANRLKFIITELNINTKNS